MTQPTGPASNEAVRRDAHAVLMAAFAGPSVPGWIVDLIRAGLGSVCLFGSNLTGDDAQLRALTDRLHAAGNVLVATDEEGGDVTRLDARRGSELPTPAALGLVDDVGLTRAVTDALAARLRSVGVDLDLAPVADVDADPRNPVIGIRSYGSDPALVARHVAVVVERLQAAGIAACAKHFPGHGDTATDSHTALPQVTASRQVLAARELVPFRAAVAAGVEAVMTGHLLVPALDPAGPASTSAAVSALLRTELGFDGVVISDALDMAGVSGAQAHGSLAAAAVAALVAGADLLCIGPDLTRTQVQGVLDGVLAAVDDGRLDVARLAGAAARVRALADRAAARRSRTYPAAALNGLADLVASRAVRVVGSLPALDGALVIRFRTPPNIAVGDVPWGLDQAGPWPGAEFVDAGPDADLPGLLALAHGRPLVAVVRDAARSPWVSAALELLALSRPDLVVVELGRRPPDPLPGRAAVYTAGASRSAARAALAQLLTSPPPP